MPGAQTVAFNARWSLGGFFGGLLGDCPAQYLLGALIMTYTILGVPYHIYGTLGPKTLL